MKGVSSQVDLISLLIERHMDLIAKDILSYLDETSLRNCESVSKSWYFVIRRGKLWKEPFNRYAKWYPTFGALLLHKKSENIDLLEN